MVVQVNCYWIWKTEDKGRFDFSPAAKRRLYATMLFICLFVSLSLKLGYQVSHVSSPWETSSPWYLCLRKRPPHSIRYVSSPANPKPWNLCVRRGLTHGVRKRATLVASARQWVTFLARFFVGFSGKIQSYGRKIGVSQIMAYISTKYVLFCIGPSRHVSERAGHRCCWLLTLKFDPLFHRL